MKFKLKEGILLQEVAGEKILIVSGLEEVDYSRMIVLNPSAALLAEMLIEQPYTTQRLVEKLTDTYEVNETQATKDVVELLEQLRELRLLEEIAC